MELKVINDEKSNKLQLHFSKTLNRAFNAFLRDLEIKKTQGDTNIYTADKIPAYDGFIENLQSLIDSGGDWRSVNVFPIFEETHESIAGRKFTIVNIHYKKGATEKKEPHIVFQLWENDVFDLARSYGRLKYGENYLTVSGAKKYLKEGRIIFKEKKIINQSIIDDLKKEKTSDRSIVEIEKKVTNSEQNKIEEAVFQIVPEEENNSLVITKTIQPYDSEQIENVLVPIAVKEPFQSGNVGIKHLEIIQSDFSKLLTKVDEDIDSLTSIELFQLSQILYPHDLGILISKTKLLQEQDKRDLKLYESLGYPTDLDYPHVSLINGYEYVSPLRKFIYSGGDKKWWWRAIAQARPIADLNRGIEIIDEAVKKLLDDRKEYINPNTNKPLRIKGFKKKIEKIDLKIEKYKISKQNILDYLDLKNSNNTSSILDSKIYQTDEEIINELRNLIQIIIEKFEVLASGLDGESEYIISTAKDAFQKISFKVSDIDFIKSIVNIIYDYKGLNSDLDLQTRSVSNPLIEKLESLLNQVRDLKTLSIEKDIVVYGRLIKNVLVPKGALEPFESGAIELDKMDSIKEYFPELFSINDSNIEKATPTEIFRLLQLEDHQKFGIDLNYTTKSEVINKQGEHLFKELGYPLHYAYPYVNIRHGYKGVLPLSRILKSTSTYFNYDNVLANWRPIADVSLAKSIIDELLADSHGELAKVITNKNKFEDELDFKDTYDSIGTRIRFLENSLQHIENYIFSTSIKQIEEPTKKDNSKKLEPISDVINQRDIANDNEVVNSHENISELRFLLSDIISELLTIEADLEGEEETIIATTVFDLERSQEQDNQEKLLIQLSLAISSFKDWVSDLSLDVQQKTIPLINRLIAMIENENVALIETISLSRAKDIKVHSNLIENVLVPQGANEPFESGNTYVGDSAEYKAKFPELYKITVQDLPNISGLNLFRLSQMGHPQEYGIDILRRTVQDEIEHRGANLFEEIGFPTDMIYPYVNIHAGYDSVHTLEYVIDGNGRSKWWWTALEHWRPVADISKAITIVDNQIASLLQQQQQYINLRTGRPKTSKDNKEAYYNLDWKIESFKKSKTHLTDYLNHSIQQEQEETTTQVPVSNDSYIDRVIVAMHDSYMKGERLSKKKIENLQESTGAPSLGALWEAVELSWLLWYKRLYKLPLPFYDRLLKMDEFWKKLQPTYAYSDSSKELYKQYSTPCPIGAIIAQYTGMDSAQSIFEPSAGNGLLLVGAKPSITHVNEIDRSRRKSLTFQRFSKITIENAALPFPKEMNEKYDVVVTNPPFSKWEDTKEEKAFIIREYFHNHRGMNHYIRLEHVMAGLALRTMKNNGRAAIITMGHLSFGNDGTWKKYRPFFSWLYRHYKVDDVINLNSYKLYNKQGAVKETMLILIGGRKATPEGVQPKLGEQPQLDTIVSSFTELWERVKVHTLSNIDLALQQLKIAVKQ
jgi:hypothetical protein